MITSYLQGGLGNQMFQIAVAYAYAKKYGYKVGFDFNSCYTPNQGHLSSKYIKTIFKNFDNIKITSEMITYEEPEFNYNEIPYLGDNVIFKGYFQSEKYFYWCRDEIISLFTDSLRNESVNDFISNLLFDNFKYVTCVHVRRGDYLEHPDFHVVCDENYYRTAIKKIPDKCDSVFVFISDDIEWCKNKFNGENFYFSPFNDELCDLSILINSNNHIISNSTFSWWGVFLCCNPNNKVISPSKWFGSHGPQKEDIMLEKWIKI